MKSEIQKLKEMKTESEDKLLFGGAQLVYSFKNGRGASIVCHDHSYGGDDGLLELAVLDKDGELDCSTPITNDVEGYLTAKNAFDMLEQIEKL